MTQLVALQNEMRVLDPSARAAAAAQAVAALDMDTRDPAQHAGLMAGLVVGVRPELDMILHQVSDKEELVAAHASLQRLSDLERERERLWQEHDTNVLRLPEHQLLARMVFRQWAYAPDASIIVSPELPCTVQCPRCQGGHTWTLAQFALYASRFFDWPSYSLPSTPPPSPAPPLGVLSRSTMSMGGCSAV